LIVVFFFACKREEKPSESVSNSSTQTTDHQLKEKDEIITSYIKAFNEIQDNLNEIKSKEKVITIHSQNIEWQQSNKKQIISDIKFIYDLLNKNRQSLGSMTEKIKEETSKNNELQKLNRNLTKQIIEQENEIDSLKNKLNVLKTELDLLNISSVNEHKESIHKTNLLNRVYFAIGTFDGLKKEGLITEKGGIVGIGKVTELDPNMDKNLFSLMDINDTKEISIAANEVKLITLHPLDSYKLEDSKLSVKKLVILNPKEFWSVSKYLILLVSSDKPLPKKHYPGWNSKLSS
jgi:hypothetical protein